MEIIWYGKTCFSIKSKKATIIIDPFTDGASDKAKLKGEIVLLTREPEEKSEKLIPVENAIKTFSWPGEYELCDIPAQGFQAWDMAKSNESPSEKSHKVTVFKMEVDGVKICHLGYLGHKLTTELIESIGDVDVLLIPIGGKHCLDAKKAHEVIEEIDPRVVIPMYYRLEDDQETSDLEPLESFAKVAGMREHTALEKYTVAARSALPQDHTEYVVLKKS